MPISREDYEDIAGEFPLTGCPKSARLLQPALAGLRLAATGLQPVAPIPESNSESAAKTEFFRELVEFTREQFAQKLGF